MVDRLCGKFYQHTTHPDLFDYMGSKVGVEFSYHTRRSWTRWLAKRQPSLSRNGLAKEIVGVVEALFLYEGSILTDRAKPIDGTFIEKFGNVESRSRVFTSPVDPTRSTDRRDSLLNGGKCEKKMWVDFRVLENSSPKRNGFALESPLTFSFIFKWGKPSKNKKPQ